MADESRVMERCDYLSRGGLPCAFQAGHGGFHQIVVSSDQIRLRILKDRVAELEARLAERDRRIEEARAELLAIRSR